MSIVIAASSAWKQGSSYLGYDNAFLQDGVVVAASAEDTGFPVEAAISWPTYGGGWQTSVVSAHNIVATFPNAVTINSMGLYKHNLGDLTGITVKLQYSTNGTTWNDLTGVSILPANNEVIYLVGTGQSAKYWRINFSTIATGQTLKVGQAFISNSLQIFSPPEGGFTPPRLAKNDDFIASRSDGGEFLGRSLIRKGYKTGWSITQVREDWVRTNWEPAMEAMQEHPFYWAWDTVNFPTEIAYCYTDGNVAIPRYESHLHMSVDLRFIALIE